MADRDVTQCAVCGEPLGASWYATDEGRAYCTRHKGAATCSWCGFPASFAMDAYVYCRECRARAVVDARQIVALGNLLRSSLRRRSCWLPYEVPLRIESRSGVPAGTLEPHVLGRTTGQFRGSTLVWQEISIQFGLPREVCLFALGHEYGHALLNHKGQSHLSDTLREGFCQYLGGVVIREQLGSSQPARILYDVEMSRRDLYGSGFRLVSDWVARIGEASVIQAILVGSGGGHLLPG